MLRSTKACRCIDRLSSALTSWQQIQTKQPWCKNCRTLSINWSVYFSEADFDAGAEAGIMACLQVQTISRCMKLHAVLAPEAMQPFHETLEKCMFLSNVQYDCVSKLTSAINSPGKEFRGRACPSSARPIRGTARAVCRYGQRVRWFADKRESAGSSLWHRSQLSPSRFDLQCSTSINRDFPFRRRAQTRRHTKHQPSRHRAECYALPGSVFICRRPFTGCRC